MTYILRGIDSTIWAAAKARAQSEGRTLRWVLLDAITRYTTEPKGTGWVADRYGEWCAIKQWNPARRPTAAHLTGFARWLAWQESSQRTEPFSVYRDATPTQTARSRDAVGPITVTTTTAAHMAPHSTAEGEPKPVHFRRSTTA